MAIIDNLDLKAEYTPVNEREKKRNFGRQMNVLINLGGMKKLNERNELRLNISKRGG